MYTIKLPTLCILAVSLIFQHHNLFSHNPTSPMKTSSIIFILCDTLEKDEINLLHYNQDNYRFYLKNKTVTLREQKVPAEKLAQTISHALCSQIDIEPAHLIEQVNLLRKKSKHFIAHAYHRENIAKTVYGGEDKLISTLKDLYSQELITIHDLKLCFANDKLRKKLNIKHIKAEAAGTRAMQQTVLDALAKETKYIPENQIGYMYSEIIE